jgi:hypothetical protein
MNRLYSVVFVAFAVALLAGCGKSGRPLTPAGSNYPQAYPNTKDVSGGTAEEREQRELELEQQQQQQQPGTMSPNGNFIDPSVRNMQSYQSGIPTNLPNTRILSNDPMQQGLGEPTNSPLSPATTNPFEGTETP